MDPTPAGQGLSRREVLVRAGGLAALSLGLPRLVLAQPRAILTPALDVTLAPTPTQVQILPGAMTNVWRYEATVNAGSPASVSPSPARTSGRSFVRAPATGSAFA